jgi:hypothetical protein
MQSKSRITINLENTGRRIQEEGLYGIIDKTLAHKVLF